MLDLLNHSNDTVVGRLVISAADDPLRQRLRLSSLLSSADFQPTGLPESALLFVRRLSDPSPELLGLSERRWLLMPEWERKVRDSLGEFMQRAARPVTGDLADSGAAVLFWDRSELLACLAQDWCAGSVSSRWWWRLLLRNDYSFWKTWISYPEYVPAAMEHLTRANKVVEFASSLTEEQARTLSQRVVMTFALHHLTTAHAAYDRANAPPFEAAEQYFESNESFHQSPVAERRTRTIAPWRDWAPPAVGAYLTKSQELFLGLTLMISRAPAVVRTRRFASAAERWQREKLEPAYEPEGAALGKEPRRSSHDETVPDAFILPSISASSESRPSIHQTATPEAEVTSDNKSPLADSQVNGIPNLVPLGTSVSKALPDEETEHPFDRLVARSPDDGTDVFTIELIEPASLADAAQTQQAITVDEDLPDTEIVAIADERIETACSESAAPEVFTRIEIETELAGLFYLINLALYLDLYGDFTRPAEPGIELNIWDFIALAGDDLIEGSADDDPVWKLLATLAGRERESEIGGAFQPPSDWQPPVEWLPAVALELNREARRHRSNITAPSAIQTWLSRLMPYARARLRAALGVDVNQDLGSLVCRHTGVVRVTQTHVDAFFNLSKHPIELRMAGLDRDPGWVPAAGRFISFHYN